MLIHSNTHSSLCIIVPQDALKVYKEAVNWSSYASKIIADNNIVDNAFLVVDGVLRQYLGNDETVSIPANITSVGNYAFAYSKVKNVTIGNDVTTMGQYAFAFCVGLQSVTIGDSVTGMGDYAFYSCSELKSVTYGTGLSIIGSYAFAECADLTQINSETVGMVDLSGNLTTIGDYVFQGDVSVLKFIIGDSVTSIGTGIFADCSSVQEIVIPCLKFEEGVKKSYTISSGTFSNNNGEWTSTNKSNSSSSTFTITANIDMDITFEYKVSSEANCDKLTIMHNATQIAQISGSTDYVAKTLSLKKGDILKFTYSKDGSQSKGADCGYIKLITDVQPLSYYSALGNYFGRVASDGCTAVNQGNVIYYVPSSLKKVTITGDQNICDNAFINCSMIEEIVLDGEIAKIGEYTFYNCANLKSVTIKSSAMPDLSEYAFNSDSSVVIKVNSAILSDYQSDANWRKRTLEAIQ